MKEIEVYVSALTMEFLKKESSKELGNLSKEATKERPFKIIVTIKEERK